MSGNLSQAGSRAELDYSRFKVKRAIDGVVKYFRGYFDKFDFNSKDTLFAMFDNYDKLSATLESIYGRILDNYDKVKLARLIAATNANDDTTGKPYNSNYNNFKLLHQSILVAKEGNSILYTARQLFFPDSISFNSTPFNGIPKAPVLDNLNKDLDEVPNYVTAIVRNLDGVRLRAEAAHDCITAKDQYLSSREFNNNNNFCGPSFCICRDVDKIRSILNGSNHVQVVASINAAENTKSFEAVKFSEIYVKFYGGKSGLLEKKLFGQYHFTLTSSGLYDYKYKDQIYRISNVIVSPGSDYFCDKDDRYKMLTTSVNAVSHGKSVNAVYEKLKEAAPLFSPYTTWTISMSRIDGRSLDNVFDLDDLSGVELHLVGEATYLDSSISIESKYLHELVEVSSDYETFKI